MMKPIVVSSAIGQDNETGSLIKQERMVEIIQSHDVNEIIVGKETCFEDYHNEQEVNDLGWLDPMING